LSDFLSLALLLWLFLVPPLGWESLLADGDTGWHIRTGDYILDHRAIPRTDLFSFSKPAAPWFAWEWGADVIFALLVRAGGLKALVLFSGALIALFLLLVFRLSLARGANPFLALLLTLLVMNATSIHFLARPHLFTLVLLPLALFLAGVPRWRWLLVPITIVWVNLHGGFVAWLVSLCLLAIGRRSLPLARLALASLAATFVNPFGYHLHLHIAAYLRSTWIRDVVHEFQSPSFRSENMFQFEILLLAGLMAAASLLARRQFDGCLLILFWAHQSLVSVRHVTIYAAVAAPLIAVELTHRWQALTATAPPSSLAGILNQMARDLLPEFRRLSLWPALALPVLFCLPLRWPTDFPASRFPVAMVNRFAHLLPAARLLTVDQWADYLLYRFHPPLRVFVDGRSDFYGPDLGNDYIRLFAAHHDWRNLLRRHDFDLILIPPSVALATLLKEQPDWRLLADDGSAVLFARRPPLPATTSGKKPIPPLMETARAAEHPVGVPAAMPSAPQFVAVPRTLAPRHRDGDHRP
jgi:hypothetical protein